MLKKRKYKIIASLLLTIFSLNTVVGFACSVGIDMGFNSKHHHVEDATEATVHIHSDGQKHIHNEKKENRNHSKSNHNDKAANHHNSGNKQDNCCNDEVTKFSQVDKTVPRSFDIIHPPFLIAFFDVNYNVDLPSPGIVKDIKQFVRSYHPPISNIRIAIQSFQI
jgi:hypothetical protein